MDDTELLDLERAFWTEDAAFYDEHLTPDCVMVFPGMGLLDRPSVLEGVQGGPRWRSVSISDPVVTSPAAGVDVLSYEAQAMRAGDEAPYRAFVSSVYVYVDGGSGRALAFHQHTPVE